MDLAGEDLDGEDLDGVVLVGVEDGAGEKEKKTKTRSADGIMDLKRELYPRNIHRLTASFQFEFESELVVIKSNQTCHFNKNEK